MMDSQQSPVVPVLLSGGSGTRLWPLSRETYPKQLLPLLGDKTLLQQTALRVADRSSFAPIIMVGNVEHRFVIGEQLRAVGVADATTILEPVGRNTAPAVAVAALFAGAMSPYAVIRVMPVDHFIGDVEAFRRAVTVGLAAPRQARVVRHAAENAGDRLWLRADRV